MIGGARSRARVPPFMIGDGIHCNRTINKVDGSQRRFRESTNRIAAGLQILFREGLTVPNALAKNQQETASAAGISTLSAL